MRRSLLTLVLIAVVLSTGCMGGTNSEWGSSTPSLTKAGDYVTLSQQPGVSNAEPWAYHDLNLEPTKELEYSLQSGSLSGTDAEVWVVVIEGPADFAKTSANWEASSEGISANNVVFQVGKNVYYFEIRDSTVYMESGRVIGDLFDFLRLDDDKYLGWENGALRLYARSLNKYREKRGVLAYAMTTIDEKPAIVTSLMKNLTVTIFVNGEAESEEYTFDCSILSMHPAFGNGSVAGFYMGTTCGFYYVDPNLNVHDSGLEGVWEIISNDHDEVGSVVLYSSDSGEVVTAYYYWDDEEVYVSEPLKVEEEPSSASASWFYLALTQENKIEIYELGKDSAYHHLGTITFPEQILDVKLVQSDENTLEIGAAWENGFAYIVVPVSELEGEHALSLEGK